MKSRINWTASFVFALGAMLLGVGLTPLIAKGKGAKNVGQNSAGQPAESQAAPEGNSPAAPAETPPAITDGPTLFRERGCAQCHEIRGAGGHKGPDLSGVGRRMKNDLLYKQIELGSAEMPAFGGVIAESEIASLVKYLGHCKDKPKKGKPVPSAAVNESAD